MGSNVMKWREEWLHEGIRLLRPRFIDLKAPIPDKVYASCGFPKGARGGHAIGQCWAPSMTADGTTQMFICPTQVEPVRVLDILTHECIHAGCGVECGHKKEFRRVAKELGLAGKMTATYAEEGTECHAWLTDISEKLGPYPHSAMTLIKKAKAPSKWVRLMSKEIPGYTLVISKISLAEHGYPTDPAGTKMIRKDGGDDEGDDDE